MKKYLFLFTGLLIAFAVVTDANAGAKKLGRGNTLTVQNPGEIAFGSGSSVSNECPAGQCKKNGHLISIADHSCSTGFEAYAKTNCDCACRKRECENPHQHLVGNECVSNCTGVTCLNGRHPRATDTGCCCDGLHM